MGAPNAGLKHAALSKRGKRSETKNESVGNQQNQLCIRIATQLIAQYDDGFY